jgi:2-iminobutanoate/2-iminopropanoate deaminase
MEQESPQEAQTSDRDGPNVRPVVLLGVPRPVAPYSPAVVAGGFVFVSGQRPQPTSGEIPDGFASPAHQVFRNLAEILEAARSGLDKVLEVNVYLADLSHFAELNSIYEQYFRTSLSGANHHRMQPAGDHDRGRRGSAGAPRRTG